MPDVGLWAGRAKVGQWVCPAVWGIGEACRCVIGWGVYLLPFTCRIDGRVLRDDLSHSNAA